MPWVKFHIEGEYGMEERREWFLPRAPSAEAVAELRRHLSFQYRHTLEEMTPRPSPGVWELPECGGRAGGCHAFIHTCMFNEGPIRHTIIVPLCHRDERGRWLPQSAVDQAWQAWRDAWPELVPQTATQEATAGAGR